MKVRKVLRQHPSKPIQSSSISATMNLRYRLTNSWSMYSQYATGNVIPSSNIFDVKNAQVAVTPKPAGTKTFQFGSVFQAKQFTLDADASFIKAQTLTRRHLIS